MCANIYRAFWYAKKLYLKVDLCDLIGKGLLWELLVHSLWVVRIILKRINLDWVALQPTPLYAENDMVILIKLHCDPEIFFTCCTDGNRACT